MITEADILNAKILIVDDLEANVLLLEKILTNAGYVGVTTTMAPRTVCDLHRKNGYDLILLDLLMPELNGFELMANLKDIEEGVHVPILVITAQPDEKMRALKHGAMAFISKPLVVAEVLLRVHNMLEVHLLHVETKNLYDQLVAEKQQSFELTAIPGAMVGVEKEERLATHWFRSFKLRHTWLQINLLTVFAAAAVVALFQDTIDRLLILTIFLPVMAGQSISTGSQALAITLRGIALGDLKPANQNRLIRKEALLGLLNGVFVGLVAALCMYLLASFQHLPNAPMLSLVVFLAMIGSCILSSICGAVVPLLLKKLGADPVVASSILLTTATDVISMGLLLSLAAMLVK